MHLSNPRLEPLRFCLKKLTKMCEDIFEFENPRHNLQILAAPHLALTEQNFLLTEQFSF